MFDSRFVYIEDTKEILSFSFEIRKTDPICQEGLVYKAGF